MYITQGYTPDCPSEDDGSAVSKGKTVKQAVNSNYLVEEWLEEGEEVEYDNNYIYLNGNPCFKIVKV